MKNFAILFIIIGALLSIVSCSTTSDDNPPTPVVDYTIKYSVSSTSNVAIDTIIYLDKDGVEKSAPSNSNFELSFVQKSNNYHAKLYVKGEIVNGTCNISTEVIQPDSSFAGINAKEYSFPTNFTYESEFKNSESK